MSTVNIRKALAQIDLDHPNAPAGLAELVTHAVADVEAIEQAAKALDAWNRNGQAPLDPDGARAWMLLVGSIARDAP